MQLLSRVFGIFIAFLRKAPRAIFLRNIKILYIYRAMTFLLGY